MSLRTRLTLLITALVVAATVMLSAIHLDAMVDLWVQHAAERASTTAQLVKREVLARASTYMERSAKRPATFEQRATVWERAIADDVEFPELLTATLASTKGIGTISVAGFRNTIVASSDPSQVGRPMTPRPTMRQFEELGPLGRVYAIAWGNSDYESTAGLADITPEGERRLVFTIQVLTPVSLLRAYIMPELKLLGLASLLVLGLAGLIAYVTSQIAYRPLTQLGQAIDRIASGQDTAAEEKPVSSAREYAIVQEKLRVLGEQFRGAQAGAVELRGGVQQLLDRMETATLLFDRQGRLTMSSPAAERLLERDRASLASASFAALFPAIASRPFDAKSRNLPVGKLRVDIDPLPGGGALVRLSDPAGRRMLESQLGVTSRLAAISRLTGRVAHEIKNPLNAIALQLEVLRTMFLDGVPEAKPRIDELLAEIVRLDGVVRTFLDFTKPVELQSEPFEFWPLVEGILSLASAEAEAAGIAVEQEPPPFAVFVRGDRNLLNQAVLNLIRNAIEAMPHGGRLRVAMTPEEGQVLLDVTDTGVGIPPENRDKIFQLYFSTKEKGSGIGLAMTYRAIQLHEGTLEVESEAGAGTTMRIRLPICAPKEVAA